MAAQPFQIHDNPKSKKEYEKIKLSLAKIEWDSVNDYADAKSDFITKILEKAKNKSI